MALTNVTDDNFQAEVLDVKDQLVLVDFWAEWCGPCRMLAPVVEKIAQKFDSKLKVTKLDVDANPKTAGDYNITGIPCCILFKNGAEVSRLIGYQNEAAFETEINGLLK